MDKARRYNKGKLRYELLPEGALKDVVEVYTKGAEKYTIYEEDGSIKEDGANNWRKGLPWMDMIASVERHIRAFKQGEDFDFDLKTKHLANAAWGLMGILEYYRIRPEFDDRQHRYLRRPKIALDIDNVICDWTKGWGEKWEISTRPTSWQFSYKNGERFGMLKEDLEQLYRDMPRQIEPSDLPFEPHCYVTARSICPELTKKWIEDNGFPCAPLYVVPFGASKVEKVKESGADWVIDDSFANFTELNNAGICTFLYDAPHNHRYEVGYKRLKDFEDFKTRFL